MPSLKAHVLHVAKGLGLFRLCRRLTRKRLRILCYHGIWLDRKHRNPFNFLYMQPERFAARMSLLQRLNYPVLGLDEALKQLDDGTLPSNAVAITIDDGWFGTYRHMVPELVQRQWPATLYLTTYYAEKQTAVFDVALHHMLDASPVRTLDCSLLSVPLSGAWNLDDPTARTEICKAVCDIAATLPDAKQRETLLGELAAALDFDWNRTSAGRFFHLMSLDEARQCAEQGIDFQLHTHRHRLRASDALCLTEEIADNRARLAQVTQGARTHFCYPSGEWNREHFAHLRAAGVTSATTTDNGMCTRDTERFALPRILDGDRMSEVEFEAELSGFMEMKRGMRSAFKRLGSRAWKGMTSVNKLLVRAKNLIDTNYGTHRGLVRYVFGQIEGAFGSQDRFRRLDPASVERLVFVCLGNINRSAFAHAVAESSGVRCASIGLATSTGARATEIARTIAPEFGVSLDAHRATDISDYELEAGDLLLVMELRHAHRLAARGIPREQIALLGHWARPIRYHIHDPQTLSIEYFRSCFAVIQPAVLRLVAELEAAGSPSAQR